MIAPQVWITLGILAGAAAGFGIYLLAMQFVPVEPALGPALRRLHPTAELVQLQSSAARPAIVLPAADLEVLGLTPERHMLNVILSGVVALILPAMISAVLVVFGFSVPWSVPLVLTVAVALLTAWWAHSDMRAKARAARGEFVRALCTYAGLTAHQVRSGHGAVEAMERAARVCHGWPYFRLRTALLTAQLQMSPPWDELKRLSDDIEVPELASFADIMRSAGSDGAHVYQTLRAQASSLRDQIRVRALEVAKTRTSKLDIPATLLIIILIVLVGYPLMAAIFMAQ